MTIPNDNLDLGNAVILTREQFWKMNPAPGTIYTEVGTHADVIVANDINVHTQEPDDILMTHVAGALLPNDEDIYIVFKWGSWDGNQQYLSMHDEAARIMDSQSGQNMSDYGKEYRHDDCRFDRKW